MHNSLLSITIPTYNRAEILSENIREMLTFLGEYQIAIYISDDSNNDETRIAIEQIQQDYPYVYYRKNTPGFGHDLNCIQVLQWADTQYAWYLGDSLCIQKEVFIKLFDLIQQQTYDYLFVNAANRASGQDFSGNIADIDGFLDQLLWHLTLTGATLYNLHSIHDLLDSASASHYKNFIQVGLILKGLERGLTRLYFIKENGVEGNQRKQSSYWGNRVLDVFAKDWSNFVHQFDDYLGVNRAKNIIRSHAENAYILSFAHCVHMRMDNTLNLKSFMRYKAYLRDAASASLVKLIVLVLSPRWLITALYQIKKR